MSLTSMAEELISALEFGAGAFIVIAMLFLVLWRGNEILYFIAGLVTFFIAITWVSFSSGVSYAMCVLSAYEMLRGLVLAITTDAPTRGLSQFKSIIGKIRDWF